MTVQLSEDYCPECGTMLTAASIMEDLNSEIMPNPGDISICFECTSYLTYDKNLKLQRMSVDDIVALDSEELYALTKERNMISKFKEWVNTQHG